MIIDMNTSLRTGRLIPRCGICSGWRDVEFFSGRRELDHADALNPAQCSSRRANHFGPHFA
jgi:hypothetical protein